MKTLILALLACLPIFAAGTVSQSINPLGSQNPPGGLPDTRVHLISISWVGDSVNGTVPATLINLSQFPNLSGYRLMSVEIQPGTPSPSANYSITITDTAGIDILQGVGASLSPTIASYSGSLTSPPLITSPTFNLSGNTVASAKGTILLYLAPLSQTTGLPPAGSPSVAGTNVFSGTNSFTGTTTVTGLFQCKNFENVQCVDGANSQGWVGADVGAWLNSAYAALPASGGEILLFGNANGAVMNFTTPVVFATSGKYVKVRCMTGMPNGFLGCTLNYTPVTATNAFTLDYTPTTGGGFAPENGLTGFTLENNGCITNGGCGSSATGIQLAGTNGGAHMADFTNMRVTGFANAFNFGADSGSGWGIKWDNIGCTWNTTCINMPISSEQNQVLKSTINNNGTGIILGTNGSEIIVTGGSIDSNTTAGVTIAAGSSLHTEGVHWENKGGTTLVYVSGVSASKADIVGGSAADDVGSGNQASAWFTAGNLTVSSLVLLSSGRTTTVSPFSALNAGKIDFLNVSSTLIPGGGLSYIPFSSTLVNGANQNVPIGSANFVRVVGPSGAFSIGGFANGTDGRQLRVFNAAGQTMTINNQDVGSTATNRILTLTGANITLTSASTDSWIDLVYDATSGFWIPTGYNNGQTPPNFPYTGTVASGTATLTTAAIAAGACGTTVTVAATGVATTDTIIWAFNAAPGGQNAGLVAWPTTNNVNFAYCSNTAETPAAATANWRVTR